MNVLRSMIAMEEVRRALLSVFVHLTDVSMSLQLMSVPPSRHEERHAEAHGSNGGAAAADEHATSGEISPPDQTTHTEIDCSSSSTQHAEGLASSDNPTTQEEAVTEDTGSDDGSAPQAPADPDATPDDHKGDQKMDGDEEKALSGEEADNGEKKDADGEKNATDGDEKAEGDANADAADVLADEAATTEGSAPDPPPYARPTRPSMARDEWELQKVAEDATSTAVDSIMNMPGVERAKAALLRAKASVDTAKRQGVSLRGHYHLALLGNPGLGASTRLCSCVKECLPTGRQVTRSSRAIIPKSLRSALFLAAKSSRHSLAPSSRRTEPASSSAQSADTITRAGSSSKTRGRSPPSQRAIVGAR
jgi:hypothetical protein